jgi:Putative Ig domain
MVQAGSRARSVLRRLSIVLGTTAAASWSLAAVSATETNHQAWRHDDLSIAGSPATSVTANHSFAFTPKATDSEGRSLTFGIEHKPSWASFSATTGELSGTPTAANVGSYSGIVIQVSDGWHRAALPAFTLTVGAAASTPPPAAAAPTISGTPATTDVAGSAYSFQPQASGPSGDTLSFSVQNKPAWANFSIATGLLSGTPTAAQTGTYSNIVVSVSDGTGSAALKPFSIVVQGSTVAPASGSAVVNWTPPTANTNGTPLTGLAGIRIYYGTNASSLSQSIQLTATQTSTTISNLAAGTWYFAGSVFTSSGAQSALSSVVSASIP